MAEWNIIMESILGEKKKKRRRRRRRIKVEKKK